MDFAGISGGLELLRDQIDGDTVQLLGRAGDFAGWPSAMAAMQAAVAAEAQADADAGIDYAGLSGAIVNLEQQIQPEPPPSGNNVLFGSDTVLHGSDNVIFS
jgi:hypothetical protein